MYVSKEFRRKSDGLMVEAMQYKLPWDNDNAITEVIEFVLKLDTTKTSTKVHDRALDVVRPLTPRWDTEAGIATLLIIDPDTSHSVEVEANQWITRSAYFEGLQTVTDEAFKEQYEPQERVRAQFQKLSEFVAEHLPGKGPTYDQAAKNIAAALIGSGWRKEF